MACGGTGGYCLPHRRKAEMLDRQRRFRFVQCRLDRPSDHAVEARVVLADADEGTFAATAEGSRADDADLWYAAEATVAALRLALELDDDVLRLTDVVAFEIAGSPAVAVSLRAHLDERSRRLFGLCQAEDDRGRAAALAVLSATNRYFTGG